MGLIFILDNLKKKFKHASRSLESVEEVQGPFTEDWKVTLVIIIYEILDLLPKMLAVFIKDMQQHFLMKIQS